MCFTLVCSLFLYWLQPFFSCFQHFYCVVYLILSYYNAYNISNNVSCLLCTNRSTLVSKEPDSMLAHMFREKGIVVYTTLLFVLLMLSELICVRPEGSLSKAVCKFCYMILISIQDFSALARPRCSLPWAFGLYFAVLSYHWQLCLPKYTTKGSSYWGMAETENIWFVWSEAISSHTSRYLNALDVWP